MKSVPKFRQNMADAEIENSVDSVQAQRVNVIFSQPIERVLDDKTADAVASCAVVVDRAPPGRPVLVGEIRTKFSQVVALRANVSVDNIENHREARLMAGVHEGL